MYDVDYTLELTSRTIFAWKRIPGVRECLYIFSSSSRCYDWWRKTKEKRMRGKRVFTVERITDAAEKMYGAKKRITFFRRWQYDRGPRGEGEYFRGKSCRKLHFSGSASFSRHLTQFPGWRERERHASLEDPLPPIASEPKQRAEPTDNATPSTSLRIIGNRKFSFCQPTRSRECHFLL